MSEYFDALYWGSYGAAMTAWLMSRGNSGPTATVAAIGTLAIGLGLYLVIRRLAQI